jgi:hypothetical protein
MPKIFKNATTAIATGVATSATLLATSTMPLPSARPGAGLKRPS